MVQAKPAVRSNSKIVVEKNIRHILSYMPGKTKKQKEYAFFEQIVALRRPPRGQQFGWKFTPYAMEKWVMGGGFIIYFADAKKYLNSLGINPQKKKYSDNKAWGLYVNLMVRDGTKLFDRLRKENPTWWDKASR